MKNKNNTAFGNATLPRYLTPYVQKIMLEILEGKYNYDTIKKIKYTKYILENIKNPEFDDYKYIINKKKTIKLHQIRSLFNEFYLENIKLLKESFIDKNYKPKNAHLVDAHLVSNYKSVDLQNASIVPYKPNPSLDRDVYFQDIAISKELQFNIFYFLNENIHLFIKYQTEIMQKLIYIKDTLEAINTKQGFVSSTDIFNEKYYPIIAQINRILLKEGTYENEKQMSYINSEGHFKIKQIEDSVKTAFYK